MQLRFKTGGNSNVKGNNGKKNRSQISQFFTRDNTVDRGPLDGLGD